MVVKSRILTPAQLDLAYLAVFLGQRVNELVLEHLVRCGFNRARESHGYLIQHLIDSERTITELAKRMEVSQQAASKSVAELVRLGTLEIVPMKDRRTNRIRLSKRGWESVQSARKERTRLDLRLMEAIGEKAHKKTRASLLSCLKELGGLERILDRRVRDANGPTRDVGRKPGSSWKEGTRS
jgi:DNA-binding MarR family transcriptional regulator